MRKYKKPLARSKTTKSRKRASMPGTPIIAAGILGIGLVSAIFFANGRETKQSSVSARVEPADTPKTEELAVPKPDIVAIPVPEIITGSISQQEPVAIAAPLPPAKPKLAKKKAPPKDTNSFFSFFSSQQKENSPKKH